jgi:hypothetical protein
VIVLLTTTGGVGAQGAGSPAAVADVWPREFRLPDATLLVYQPQVESWDGNVLSYRAAVGVKAAGTDQETFGVMWATARTQVDRVARMVTLEQTTLTKSYFPTLADNGAAYMRGLTAQVAAVDKRMIALDRLEASLAVAGAAKTAGVAVNNAPPEILVSYAPAILVPIDGTPVLRPVPNTRFERVINTHALILRLQGNATYYLHVYDGWLSADTLGQPWAPALMLPAGIDGVAQQLAQAGLVDLIDGGKTQPRPSLDKGAPAIYVRQKPAELLVFKGQPAFAPIPGTALRWGSNTANDVILDSGSNTYYVLVSGRWYSAPALTGPWTFVASNDLPGDFRRIPPDSPAGVVLASVAGTPQAQEAVIANSIPQTASIPRVNGRKLTATFDGPPQLVPLDDTPLVYVTNSSVPMIVVDARDYYALQAGVWFYATSVNGPWMVAPLVPAVIYTIPATSPLHYVTYVRVYGSTAQTVYVGYTPGYMGTVVTPDGVVVYGTGYVYEPWVGTVWYAPPVTYGVMAQPVYNPAVGVTFGFAMGVTTAAVAYGWGGSAYYHPGYVGYPCCGSASASVYGQYGSAQYSGSRTYYSSSSGAVGTTASGTYRNTATGTTGSYEAGRSYDPSTGQSSANYARSFNTTSGASGSYGRGASYNAQTGTAVRDASGTVTGPGGTTTTAGASRSANVYGQQSGEAEHTTTTATGASRTGETIASAGPGGSGVSHSTTMTNPSTGQARTSSSSVAREGNTVYADHDGNVYKNSGSGWQQHTSSGWQSASKAPESVENESHARSQGESRYNSFKESGGGNWGSRSGEERSAGGRSGGEGGWGGRGGGGRGGGRR